MAGAIRGITVEIGGNTTKLGKALADVSKQSKNLQSELKGVTSLLKFDPGNVTLLKQKQDLLNKSIETTREKLQTLKDAQAQVQEQFDKGEITEEQYRDFQREIVATEQKLKSLEEEARKFGSVAAQQIAAVGEKMKEVGERVTDVGEKFSKLSAVTGAVLVGSTKLASDYEDAVAKVGTVADTSSVALSQLSDDMLTLSTQTGKSATEIADATYQAISASVDTADAVQFVAIATSLARAGFLETSSAVDVLTTIINAYGLSVESAAGLSDKLIQTQNDGKTTVNELAASIGKVIPLAAAYGVDIDNLCASYAQLTRNGISTANATTYLKSMLNELGDAGSTVGGILQEETGKSFGQLMADGATLGDVLAILKANVEGDQEAFAGLWGSTEAGTGALSLIRDGAEAFNAEMQNMAGSLGNTATALEMLDTPSAKAQRGINALKNAGITLGETILAMIGPTLEKLASAIQNLANWFQNLSPGIQQTIVVILGVVTAVGPLLVVVGKVITAIGSLMTVIPAIVSALGTVGAAFSALWAIVMMNPIVAIVAAVVAALVLLYNKCDWFRDGVNSAFQAVKEIAVSVFEALVTFFTVTVPNAISSVVAFFTGLPGKISAALSSLVTSVTTVFNNVKTAIFSVAEQIYNNLPRGFQLAVQNVQTIIQNLVSIFTNIFGIIQTYVETVISVIVAIFSGDFASIPGIVSGALGQIYEHFSSIFDSVITIVINMVAAVINYFRGMVETWIEIFISLRSTLSDWWANLKDLFITTVQNVITSVVTFFSQLPGKIYNAIVSAIERVKTWGTNLLNTAKTAATTLVNNVFTTMSQIPGKVTSAIAGALTAVTTWGSNMVSTAKAKMTEVISGITDAFRNLPSTMMSIGQNVIQGLINGISSMVSSLYGSIVSALSGLVSKAKAALGIASPSKVFRDVVGKQIPAGIAVGVEKNQKVAEDAVDNMVESLTDQEIALNGATMNRKLEATFTAKTAAGQMPTRKILDPDTLFRRLDNILDRLGKLAVYLDSGELVGGIIDKVDEALSDKYGKVERGW